ncbi:hypothetical protein [Aliarcobacter butzleri]|uniref:hypothetical protein n=1 Tax=Aliarcobacter butzleri TaxID=28197 RepID=UPI0021B587C5|nr:hypothetical protein [Aliarcobacter butzleri]MCT7643837.1 hypothetical protein [Aliarcobacter butzleri]
MNPQNIEVLWIFVLTVFLTLLYKLEEIFEDEIYKATSWKVLMVLVLTSTLTAGVIAILVWYSLEEMRVSFSFFGKQIELKGWVNVFLAVTIPFFYKEMIAVVKKRMNILANKEA